MGNENIVLRAEVAEDWPMSLQKQITNSDCNALTLFELFALMLGDGKSMAVPSGTGTSSEGLSGGCNTKALCFISVSLSKFVVLYQTRGHRCQHQPTKQWDKAAKTTGGARKRSSTR